MKRVVGILWYVLLATGTTITNAKHRRPPGENIHADTQQKRGRIVGGHDAEAHEFDYFVRYAGCGGSLIARDLVLTAAHCDNNVVHSTVKVGAFSATEPGTERTIAKRKVHPEWDKDRFRNDFMILKLTEAVDHAPVSINSDSNVPLEGQRLTVIGMGRLSEGGTVSNTLQKVDVNYIPYPDCISTFEFADRVTDDIMMCAGAPYRDSCKGMCVICLLTEFIGQYLTFFFLSGDSGGPLIARRHDGSDVQVGVVSWGLGCARPVSTTTHNEARQKMF